MPKRKKVTEPRRERKRKSLVEEPQTYRAFFPSKDEPLPPEGSTEIEDEEDEDDG